jgi:acylphosphatase
MDNRVRAHINITGRVQGVCFRLETQRAARKRGVVGWVRNLPDGSVEAVMEGGKFAVESLIHWCRKGPPVSNVEEVAVDWGAFTGEFTAFEVTY